MGDDIVGRKKDIHIGLIPDGNRRWAQDRKKKVWKGHHEGAKRIRDFLKWCINTKIANVKHVSIFVLSVDNLARNEKEVEELWNLYEKEFATIKNDELLKRNEVKVNILGARDFWNPKFREVAKEAMDATKMYANRILNLAVAYSSKLEIANAVKKMFFKSASSLDKYLMVQTPLDLLIRTGNQYRLSNFFLYQSAYTEIYFSKTLWPDFTKKEFDKILRWYLTQVKKFGK